jgi:RNA polymerase sigma-70 factor (ECF subfamily)
MLHNDQDEQDIDALRSGDRAAFTRLVARHHRRLLVVARAIVGDVWADEVVQEAWIAAHRALPKFEGRSSLQTWLYTIVRNEARTRLGKEARYVSLDSHRNAQDGHTHEDTLRALSLEFRGDGHWQSAPSDWHTESPLQLLEHDQLQRCIDSTLQRLSADQRAVFTLRDLQQMELQQICNILELSNSNVRVLLHRARLTLMQVIDRYQETGTC